MQAGYLRDVESGIFLRVHLNTSGDLDDWLERISALEAHVMDSARAGAYLAK